MGDVRGRHPARVRAFAPVVQDEVRESSQRGQDRHGQEADPDRAKDAGALLGILRGICSHGFSASPRVRTTPQSCPGVAPH